MTARRAAQARAPVLSVGDVLDLPFAGACAPRDPTARRLSTPHRLNGHRNGERPRLSAGVTDPGVLLSLVATGRGHLAAPATSGRFYVHPAIAWVPVPSATPFSEGVVVPSG